MKSFLLFLVLIFMIFRSTNAQVRYKIRRAVNFFKSSITYGANATKEHNEINSNRACHLYKHFIEGSDFVSSKSWFADTPLRYSIFNDQIEFKTDDQKGMALAVPKVIEITETGEFLFEYIPCLNSNSIECSFPIVQDMGRVNFLYPFPDILQRGKKNYCLSGYPACRNYKTSLRNKRWRSPSSPIILQQVAAS